MDTETSERSFSPPYNIPFATFLNTLDKVANDLPNRVDRQYLASRSGGEQSYLISAFRGFDLIQPETGEITETLRSYAKADEAGRIAILRQLVEARYPQAVTLGASNSTSGELDEAFATMFPSVTGESRRKAVRFFLSALEVTGLQKSPLWKAPKAMASAGPRKRAAKRTGPPIPAPIQPAGGAGTSRSVTLRSGGTVTLGVTVDLFQLSRDDRGFVLELIDALTDYENRNPPPPDGDGEE